MTTTPSQPAAAPTFSIDECDEAFVRDFMPYNGDPDPHTVWRAAWESARAIASPAAADECEAFEKWASNENLNLTHGIGVPYYYTPANSAWFGWQARAALSTASQRESALARFHEYGAEEEADPLERLRAFCSLAMNGQDWIDVEPFFDAVAERTSSPQGEAVVLTDVQIDQWAADEAYVMSEPGVYCLDVHMLRRIIVKAAPRAPAPDAAPAGEPLREQALLEAASHALRSYQYGNSATDLAKDLADKIDAALAAPAGKPDQFQSLRDALVAYVKAQGRMLDKWADGDDNVKRDLWTNLHACEEPAREALAAPAGEPAAKSKGVWPHEATDRVHELMGQLAAKELELHRLREKLAAPGEAK